jgi:hypothetical protein
MKLLLVLLLLGSCATHNKSIISEKNDYLIFNEDKYISTTVDTNTNIINDISSHQIIIRNPDKDTVYVFSTVFSQSGMFYSEKNIHRTNNKIYIKNFYRNFIRDASYSGIKKFNFIRILPGDSLIVNVDEKRIVGSERMYDSIVFSYYYFIKPNEYNEGGVYNIDKYPLRKREIRMPI